MGGNLLRGKTLILPAAALLCLAAPGAFPEALPGGRDSIRESAAAPAPAAGGAREGAMTLSPASAGGSGEYHRRAIRRLRPETAAGIAEEAPDPSPPRQHHGGPDVFSPPFGEPRERVDFFLRRMEGSAAEAERIQAAMRRAAPYAHFIRQRIQERGLPPELFYLPVVESLYIINARSRSGALGLWQFMANSVGSWMRMDEWADERKDFWKSTQAALEKLELNHRATGDWLLALAAYNCGLGCLQRAVGRTGIRDFWELSRGGHLPPETRDYVPKFIATARFASSLGRRNPEVSWDPPVTWERIPLARTADLRLLAQAAGVPQEALKLGNAELHYGITPPPGRGYQLKVPAEYREQVEEALKSPDGKLMRFAIHTVAAGHTLSEIAAHYRIPLSMVQRYNPGLRPDHLKIGTKIIVPMIQDIGPFVKKPRALEEETLSFENLYTAQPGDSLWSIAGSFGISAARLARANSRDENGLLRAGEILKVP